MKKYLKIAFLFICIVFISACNRTLFDAVEETCRNKAATETGDIITIEDYAELYTADAYKDCHAEMEITIRLPYLSKVYKLDGEEFIVKNKNFDIIDYVVPEFGTVMGVFINGPWVPIMNFEKAITGYSLEVSEGAKNDPGESVKYHIALKYKESYKNSPVYQYNSMIYTKEQILAKLKDLPEMLDEEKDDPKYYFEVFQPLSYEFEIRYKKFE